MADTTLLALLGTAATIGLIHTLTGPDHYIPFIAMSRVGRWSLPKTVVITLLCGLGHVAGSIVLGALGIAAGWAVVGLEVFEALRGDLAAWLLLGFGLAYMAWGIRRAIRNRPHTHRHAHADGTIHLHEHAHTREHAHPHAGELGAQPSHENRAAAMTPWVLFTIFVFGPCEPLIPILMYPAAKLSLFGVILVALVFGVFTLGTMTALVVAGYYGLMQLSLGKLARYSHALAGLALLACGAAIKFGF